MTGRFTTYQLATAIAVLFHTIGITGILCFNKQFIIETTSLNLLLMCALLIWTQKEKNAFFYLFFLAVFCIGTVAEVIGVNTGNLFGVYAYGNALGYKARGVPLIIGINWFVIIYCCGISIHTLLMKAISRIASDTGTKPLTLKALSVIIDGATMAVFFDWVMEPVAARLGYWTWDGDGSIPMYNYICWFGISMMMLALFHFGKFNKQNKFAVHLLLIQLMFFLILRTVLL